MKTKHSKLPWNLSGDPRFVESDRKLVAAVYEGMPMNEPTEELIANANFIAKACNSHYQLVEALKDALAVIRDYLEYEHDGDPWTEDARAMGEMDIDDYERDGRLDRAEAILAAAGEQS